MTRTKRLCPRRLCLDVCLFATFSFLPIRSIMTRLRQRLLAWTLVSALSLFTTTTTASVLAIDYGTDFIKASLMKPGVAFDVLLNRDSKRKIAASIAWKGDERLFGTDAVNIVRISFTTRMQRGLTEHRQHASHQTHLVVSSSYRVYHSVLPKLSTMPPSTPSSTWQSRIEILSISSAKMVRYGQTKN